MKDMVAMELGVVRLLAGEARAAGLDPARDPIPGLRRDVLFTCTADEEAGGQAGAAGSSTTGPTGCGRRARLNESGGVSTTVAGVRLYPIQVAEKGYAAYRISRPRDVGPRLDAARGQRRRARRGQVVGRLAGPGRSASRR